MRRLVLNAALLQTVKCLEAGLEHAQDGLKQVQKGAEDEDGRSEEELKTLVAELEPLIQEMKEEVSAGCQRDCRILG